jgi:8-oxo-dGTP diphosphatase
MVTVFGVLIEEGSILLIRRAKNPYIGMCTVPGGHKRHGEILKDAAVREMTEETGLTLRDPKLCGHLEVHIEGDERDFLSVYFRFGQYSGSLRESDEGPLFWLPLSEVPKTPNLHPAFMALAPYFQDVGCFFAGHAKVNTSGQGSYDVESIKIQGPWK